MRQRERSAELTSKYGFSVVAPTSVMSPSSTAGSSASCWALLKRWISSRKKIVCCPVARRRSSARLMSSRTSERPTSTADSSSNAAEAFDASIRASVVFPDPGGPYRIIECGRPSSMARRSAESGPRMCSCPTNWSSAAGRMRTGSGCSAGGTRVRVLAGFWSPASNSCSTLEFWQQAYSDPMPDLEQRTTELLQRLIQFNTVNPPGNEQAAQEFLKEKLEAAGFECELLAAVEGRPNLVARLRAQSDGPRLALLGHVDTVLADAD